MNDETEEPTTPPAPPAKRSRPVRFDFPPGATPAEIADAINRLRKECEEKEPVEPTNEKEPEGTA